MRARNSLGILAVLFAIAGCEQGTTLAAIEVEIIDAAGANPVEARDGTITISVRHAGELVLCDGATCTSEIVDGAYELSLPVASFEGRTRAHVVIESERGLETDRWIGATPPFALFGEGVDVAGRLRLVVEEPGASCEPLTLDGFQTGEPPLLSPARMHVASVVRRNVVLFVGGESVTGEPDDHADRFDQLLFDADSLQLLPRDTDLGPARGLALSDDVSLVVGARTFSFTLSGGPLPTVDEIVPHVGAGFASALVGLGADGAALVGGDGSNEITWIGIDGRIAASRPASRLTVLRRAPAAARLDDGILVVGGHAAGEASAEWISDPGGPGVVLESVVLPVGRGGFLVPSPNGRAALYLGFEREDGTPSAQTFVIRGCPAACVVTAGEDWPAPRSDVAFVVTEAGGAWLAGGMQGESASALVDRVVWEADRTVRIEPGPMLASARAGATAFEHASGVVIVAGGIGDGGAALGDLEICVPSALDDL